MHQRFDTCGLRQIGAADDYIDAVFADQSPERASLLARGFEVMPSGTYLERRLGHNSFDERFTTDWLREHWWYTIGDSDLV